MCNRPADKRNQVFSTTLHVARPDCSRIVFQNASGSLSTAEIDAMAQKFFPARVASPVSDISQDLGTGRQFKVDDVQEAYVESKDRCAVCRLFGEDLLNGALG